eukprot:1161005-Pelagomonas_calceolata.AAC.2
MAEGVLTTLLASATSNRLDRNGLQGSDGAVQGVRGGRRGYASGRDDPSVIQNLSIAFEQKISSGVP